MKWNVEEANPKTGEYRTLNIDAPDHEAAEALGKFMGLSASDISHRQTRLDTRTSSHPAAPAASRRGLPTYMIVLLSAGATLICTAVAVWVVKSVAAVPAPVAPTAVTAAVDDGEIEHVKLETTEDSKLVTEISDADRAKEVPADEVKPPSEEQPLQVNLDNGEP